MEMKTTMDEVGVDFVNVVLNQGVFDGVFNINFATFLFTPTQERPVDDGTKTIDIDPELVISVRLRMGEQCLRQLHQAAGNLIKLAEEARAKQASRSPGAEDAEVDGARAN